MPVPMYAEWVISNCYHVYTKSNIAPFVLSIYIKMEVCMYGCMYVCMHFMDSKTAWPILMKFSGNLQNNAAGNIGYTLFGSFNNKGVTLPKGVKTPPPYIYNKNGSMYVMYDLENVTYTLKHYDDCAKKVSPTWEKDSSTICIYNYTYIYIYKNAAKNV